ncbi:MAG TPA: zinc ABC transporter substrate-binding protein [Caulifigura sp.]|jgi:manganese/zinc/iron transport system substrate-binding protein|nr:zinc ABC transporter substrate-binding protein [Caulifigura sp.]
MRCPLQLSVGLLFCLLALTGCPASKSTPNATPNGLKIVATTGMVADLVKHIVGQHGSVQTLMSAGVDPHLYKPTTSDVADIQQADLVFYNGLGLEGPMEPVFKRDAEKGRKVIPVAGKLSEAAVHHSERFSGHADPHVWMDVSLWIQCLDPIVEALSAAAPAKADEFRANADAYREELKKLDDFARSAIRTIPPPQRTLVTAHDAFSYFAKAYGIEVKAVQGITTESEPGVDDVNTLVKFLVEKKIPALFVESSVSDRNLMAVLEGVAKHGGNVSVGGRLFSDAMGAEGTYEGTYVGMIDHNVTVIVRALGGEAPQRGLNGKLAETAAE